MKKVALLFSISLFLIACGHGPSKKRAYFQGIMKIEQDVLQKEDTLIGYIMLINKENQDLLVKADQKKDKEDSIVCDTRIDSLFLDFGKSVENGILAIEKIELLEKDDSLKPAAHRLLKQYKVVSDLYYPNLIRLLKKPDENYSEEDDQEFLNISQTIDSILNYSLSDFRTNMQAFAIKHGFSSFEELQKKP